LFDNAERYNASHVGRHVVIASFWDDLLVEFIGNRLIADSRLFIITQALR
jgi:hypothetical protein